MMDVDDKQEKVEKRKQAPCRDPPHVKRPSLGEKSYVAAIELALNQPDAYKKFDQQRRKVLRDYVTNNQENFCKTCGLNIKFKNYLFSSDEYQALVVSALDSCNICGAKKDKICDVYTHQRYHRRNCLTQ